MANQRIGIGVLASASVIGMWACSETTSPSSRSPAFAVLGAGGSHTCALTADGRAYCWGLNASGQLGIGTKDNDVHTRPEPVVGGYLFAELTVGHSHVCGLTSSGTALCWGQAGRIGDGAVTDRVSPVPVQGGSLIFTGISAGGDHTCAIAVGNATYCWGGNGSGQIGDSSRTDRAVPTLVTGGIGFRSVVAGTFHTCALTPAGTAYCWGDDLFGQLGHAGTPDNCPGEACSISPILVSGGLAFTALIAGTLHSCGIAADSSGYCWGDGVYGQLGNGSQNGSSTPTLVVDKHKFTVLSTNHLHTCGVAAPNLSYCWGWNLFGQLGIGSANSSPVTSPAQISGQYPFSLISAGNQHSCAITVGVTYCWGAGNHGQLGTGDTLLVTMPSATK